MSRLHLTASSPAGAVGGLAYPDRFHAAASYAGFGLHSPIHSAPFPDFSPETYLILYALYRQATEGPCNVPQPRGWDQLENDKWNSWKALGNMASVEAMRLFVKILQEEDPAWLSKIQIQGAQDSSTSVEGNTLQDEITSLAESIPVSHDAVELENGHFTDAEEKDILVEGLSAISAYNKWVPLETSGRRPVARYQHAAVVLRDKMYVIGGNHNGRYLNDVQILDLSTLSWSKIEQNQSLSSVLPPLAGHSLICWGSKLLAIAGHMKDFSGSVVVHAFDTETCSWSLLESYGKAPIARGGQSVTLVGSNLVMFGGEDSKRHLFNDLNILDLETMTWDAVEPVGVPPSPRSDHKAAIHAGRYLLIFGGGSHSTCFNDLHVLDLESMEWSQPEPQGTLPSPRAGHAGISMGENWYIVGGGDNKSGISETAVLNMSNLVWSVATSVQRQTSVASEGLSVVCAASNGEEVLVAFGGYNGHYNNEVHIMKMNQKTKLQPRILESPAAAAAASSARAAFSASQDLFRPKSSINGIDVKGDSEFHVATDITQENGVKEIMIDSPKSDALSKVAREHLTAVLKIKSDLEESITMLQNQNTKLKDEVVIGQSKNTELSKELHNARGQLAAEQSRCFRLEVEVAELRQKLQSMDSLQKQLELLQRQKAASEQAAVTAVQKQSSGGVWGWLAGASPE